LQRPVWTFTKDVNNNSPALLDDGRVISQCELSPRLVIVVRYVAPSDVIVMEVTTKRVPKGHSREPFCIPLTTTNDDRKSEFKVCIDIVMEFSMSLHMLKAELTNLPLRGVLVESVGILFLYQPQI